MNIIYFFINIILFFFCLNTNAFSTEYTPQPGDFYYDYIFEEGSIWIDKDIITKKDPSLFISIKFIKEKKIEWYDQRNYKKNKKQYQIQQQKIFYDVYIFRASFKNSNDILIRVNKEFKTKEKAEKQASIYAYIYGQMPNFLKQNAKTLTIHKGNFAWMGGYEDIIIYTNLSKAFKEEAMFHELTHVSLDYKFAGGSVDENAWRNAILQDKYYLTRYAYDYFYEEDLAETVLWWFATKCKPSTISKKNYDRVIKHLPNRFKYLDQQKYDFNPVVCE